MVRVERQQIAGVHVYGAGKVQRPAFALFAIDDHVALTRPADDAGQSCKRQGRFNGNARHSSWRALGVLWFGHYALGRLHSITPTGDTEAALDHLRTAMELQPANDDARVYYGIVLMMSGKVTRARAILEGVIAGHPNPPFWYYLGLANALFHLEEYGSALDIIARCLSQMPNSPYCLRTRISVEARLGRLSDAEWSIEEYAILGHDASLAAVMKSAIERDPSMLDHLRQSYRMAGLE